MYAENGSHESTSALERRTRSTSFEVFSPWLGALPVELLATMVQRLSLLSAVRAECERAVRRVICVRRFFVFRSSSIAPHLPSADPPPQRIATYVHDGQPLRACELVIFERPLGKEMWYGLFLPPPLFT